MTEMVNGESQSLNNSAGLPDLTSSQPTSTVSDERTFKQSEVNDIVGRAKHEAVDRYRRDQTQQYQPTQQYSQPQVVPQNPHYVGMSPEEVKRLTAEEIQRSRNEWVAEAHRSAQEQEAQRIATDFFTKLEAGKGKFNDFDKVIKEVEFAAIPNIVHLANQVDNTAEVMYELANNPAKIASIHQLVSISPKLALSEMMRLSQSIKDNEQAANYRSPNEPLSQLRPSNTSTGNGALTVSDFRKKYKV